MNVEGAESGYLVLRNEAELGAFRIVARAMLMEQVHVEDNRSTRANDYLEVWKTPDRERTLSYIEEPRVYGRFLWYRGKDAENALKIAHDALPSATADEVRDLLNDSNSAHDEIVLMLHLAAYVTPQERPDLLAVFRRYLADSRETIRKATVRAFSIRCWPGLLQDVERASKEDASQDVRDYAVTVLRSVTGASDTVPHEQAVKLAQGQALASAKKVSAGKKAAAGKKVPTAKKAAAGKKVPTGKKAAAAKKIHAAKKGPARKKAVAALLPSRLLKLAGLRPDRPGRPARAP